MKVSSLECLPWLRDARKLLAAICGPQSGLITVTIHNSRGQGVEFLLPPEEKGRQAYRPRPVDPAPAVVPRFRRVEQAALDAADDKPMPVKALANKAGYKSGSYFSEAVTHLCRLGMLTRTPDGILRRSE
jgi:hypothetical protein